MRVSSIIHHSRDQPTRLYHGQPTKEGEEVVVLSQVLAADSTNGYEDVSSVQVGNAGASSDHDFSPRISAPKQYAATLACPLHAHRPNSTKHARNRLFETTQRQVISFNGAPVNNLRHLAELVTASTDRYLRFDCEYREALVLDRAAAFRDTAAVSERAGWGGRRGANRLGTRPAAGDVGSSHADTECLLRSFQRPQVLEAHSIPAALSSDLEEGLPPWPPREAGKAEPVAAGAAAA
jgi:hypothetical protein